MVFDETEKAIQQKKDFKQMTLEQLDIHGHYTYNDITHVYIYTCIHTHKYAYICKNAYM